MKGILRSDWFLLALILALGAALRFGGIAHSSIWHDEGFTMFLIDRSPSEIIDATARDVHPPLHYLFLHYWVMIFGHSEAAARGLSAVFGLGTVALAYGIMRRLIGREAGLLAALFVSLAPFLVRYSQEARMYGQVAFFAALSTYAFVRGTQERLWRWWALYALSLAAAVYTQYYGVLVVAGHATYAGVRLIWPEAKAKRRDRIRELAGFSVGVVSGVLLFLPWVPVLLEQVSRVSGSYWIQQSWMTVHTIPSTIYEFFWYDHLDRFRLTGYLHEIPLLLMAAVTGWALWRFRGRWRENVFLLALFLGPMLIIFAYSKLRTPVYQDRYFPFAAVGFYLLLVLWARAPKRRVGKAAVTASICALMLVGNGVVYAAGNHQMRQAAALVNEGYRPGDLIVSLDLYTFFDFSYYNRTGEPALLYNTGSLSTGEPGLLQGREWQRVKDLRAVRPESGRVWAVGKPGKKGYYTEVPASWRLERSQTRGSVEIREYQVPREAI